MSAVLDASAVLALMHGEPGAENVARRLTGAVMSVANAIEVGTRLVDRGASFEEAWDALDRLDIELVDLDVQLGAAAVELRNLTRTHGLSLADRACLALAVREGLPAVTADRVWSTLDVGCKVELIR